MTNYLEYEFRDTKDLVDTFDELPLWSAPFGMLLLQNVPMSPGMNVLDIGTGTGFPIFEFAERLGKTCKCYGLDPWKNAIERARKKIIDYDVSNVEIIEGNAEEIPSHEETFDLVISNLGINNFSAPEKVFAECYRVLKPNGKFSIATNIEGHWEEFYEIFLKTLLKTGLEDSIEKLNSHIQHRGNKNSLLKLYEDAGFKLNNVAEDTLEMRFLNGRAFFDHHFIKLGFLGSWKEIVPEEDHLDFFMALEEKLNEIAEKQGELKFTVPVIYMEGIKHTN